MFGIEGHRSWLVQYLVFGLGFRFRVEGLGFRGWGLGLRCSGLRGWVQGYGV